MPTGIDHRVLRSELVPTNAGGLSCLPSYLRRPAKHVDPIGHGFEVPRIHAGSIAAQVVKVQAGGNLSPQQLVGDSVCATWHAVDAYAAVPVDADLASPPPALAVLLNELEEPVHERRARRGERSSAEEARCVHRTVLRSAVPCSLLAAWGLALTWEGSLSGPPVVPSREPDRHAFHVAKARIGPRSDAGWLTASTFTDRVGHGVSSGWGLAAHNGQAKVVRG